MDKLSEKYPRGVMGSGGQVTVMAPKRVKIDHFLIFIAHKIIGENDVIGALAVWRHVMYLKKIRIVLLSFPQREARLRFGSVSASLVDSLQ